MRCKTEARGLNYILFIELITPFSSPILWTECPVVRYIFHEFQKLEYCSLKRWRHPREKSSTCLHSGTTLPFNKMISSLLMCMKVPVTSFYFFILLCKQKNKWLSYIWGKLSIWNSIEKKIKYPWERKEKQRHSN